MKGRKPGMPKFRTVLGRVGTLFLFWLAVLSGGVIIEVAALTAPALAQEVVRDIRVSGNKRVEPETVRSYLAFTSGDRYSPAKVDQSVKALFSTGLFSDVSIDRQGGTVIVTVVENPVVGRVAFEGAKDVESATLKGEVQLRAGQVFTRAKAQADVQRILNVYRAQGRYAASVEPKIIEQANNRVDVVFEINEGDSTKVKSIQFIGNHAFSDSQLRDIITTTQTNLFSFLKPTNIYDGDRVNLDRELLRQFYLKNGYADARVISATADLDRDGSGFFIVFTVEEGDLYYFGDLKIESALTGVDPVRLRSDLLMSKGDIYNGSLIDKTVEKMTLSAAEQGFAFARVRPKADRDAATHKIALSFLVDEGPRIYIERINVSGNTRTRDYVIRREFRLAEGDAFNPLLVDRAKKRLTNLGFFKGVEVKREPGSSPDRVVLNVEVTEQSTGELSFGAGYSTSEGAIGDVSITERNLLGRGQFLRFKVSGSAHRIDGTISFTEPRFLDQNLAAGFDLFSKTTTASNYQTYDASKTGFSLRLGMPITENVWFTPMYTLSYDKLYNVDPNTASLAVIQAAGDTLTSSAGFILTYDTRNHPKNPNRGLYFALSQEVAGLGGDVQYYRGTAEARGYYPLTEKITLVGRAVGGVIEGYGGQQVRLIDSFFRGGETIRGFKNSGFGPRDLAALNQDPLGGKYFWATTAEARFPLPFVPDELGMSGAVFADAGSLWGSSVPTNLVGCGQQITIGGVTRNKVCLADENVIRASAGVSLIWNSPLGPLRADVAWALKQATFDQTQVFRFGASTQF